MSSSSYVRGTRKRSGSLADLRHAADVAAAYNTIAPTYNRLVREDQWMREVLWRHYDRLFRSGDRVLDVACGTGLDALHLARRGVRVTGIDLAPRMIEELEREALRQGVDRRIQARVADVRDLATWPGKYFHGGIAAFAGLNTVRHLSDFAADSARLLLPRGRLVAHMLAPGDFWERRRMIRDEGPKAAFEHLRRRHRSKVIAGQPIDHRVISASEAYHRYFERHFRLRRRYGLGFLLPQGKMVELRLSAARHLGRLEAWLGRWRPFLYRSRFYVLDLESRIEIL